MFIWHFVSVPSKHLSVLFGVKPYAALRFSFSFKRIYSSVFPASILSQSLWGESCNTLYALNSCSLWWDFTTLSISQEVLHASQA